MANNQVNFGLWMTATSGNICKGQRERALFLTHHVGRTSVDTGASANLELVDKFCMLSEDGDADAAVEARIRIG